MATPLDVGSPSRMRSLAGPITCGCALAAGAVYVAAVDPSRGGTFLQCPFRLATGLWCPGCGLTRAAHHLLTGDVPAALRFNVLAPLFLAAAVYGWSTWMLRAAGSARAGRWPAALATPVAIGVAVALVAFAVVRNLPGAEALRGG